MKIKINSKGYLESPYINDANIEIEITDKEFEKTSTIPFFYNGRYINNKLQLEPLMTESILRQRREKECFRVLDNKSQMGYRNLTDEQNEELNTGYQAGLNVTDTKIIPETPSGLK